MEEDQPVPGSIVDVSDFMEVVCSYRCKICNIICDSSESMTSHIVSVHLQKVPSAQMNVTESRYMTSFKPSPTQIVSGVKATIVETMPRVFPGRLVYPPSVDSNVSTTTQSIESSQFIIENRGVADIPCVASSLQSTNNGTAGGEPSEVHLNQEPPDIQLNNSIQDTILQSSDPACDQNCAREMSFHINGVEVRLVIPDEIALECNSSTKNCQWVRNSAVSVAGSVQTDAEDRSHRSSLKTLKHSVDSRTEHEQKSSSTVSSPQLFHSLEGIKLCSSEVGEVSRPAGESDLQELFVCTKCPMGFVTLEDCRLHMTTQHGELVNVSQLSDDTAMPPNMVSIGTQAQMYKKPGRKRKVIGTTDVGTPYTEESPDRMVVTDVIAANYEISENSYAADKSMNIFGIARTDNATDGQQKRRVRPPKALVEDYFISRRKNRRRQPSFESFPLRCEVQGCIARFSKLQSLSYHKTCHFPTNKAEKLLTYICPECNTTFVAWKVLRMHLWKVHTIDSDLYKCQTNFCKYRTDSLQKLELHQETHNDARPHSCQNCGKSFKQRNQLRNHELTHIDSKVIAPSSSAKNKECSICKRIFANQKSLKKHVEVVHDRKKPYLCNTCGHETSRKAMLDLHLRTHTGEKPYRCDMCNYMASDHNTLRRHRMRHTGEKPYKCVYCAYSCIQAISLKTHLKNKHPGCEGIYSCSSCQYQTVNKQHWLNHLEDHKNNLINNDETRQINVVISQDQTESGGNKGQVVCISSQGENSGNGNGILSAQAFSGPFTNSTQESYAIIEFAPPSYGEPVSEQVQSSSLEGTGLKGVAAMQGQELEGRTFISQEAIGQQVVQLTQSSDGYYVITNDSNPLLMASIQQMERSLYPVDGSLYTTAVVQMNSDLFVQQSNAGTGEVSNQSNNISISHSVLPSSSEPVDAGGLHHILSAISAQQQQKPEAVNTEEECT